MHYQRPVRVFVSRRLPVDPAAVLPDHEVDVWDGDRPPTAAELRERCQGADALLSVLADRIDADFLDACPMLKVVASFAVGFDNMDLEAARERDVWLTHTPGVLTDSTADLAMTLLLAVARRLPEAEDEARTGHFGPFAPTAFLGLQLAGATLGIVGMGSIGRAVARRARAFGMDVLYTSRSPIPVEDREGGEPVELEELMARSDVVSLHCPLTPETRGLLSADMLARAKKGAILVNTARGPIVDEAALVALLEQGHFAGAGLDVFEEEPRVHPGLLERRDVVLTPHIGSATHTARRAMAHMALRNIAAVLRGETPPNPVPGSRSPS